MIPHLAGSGPSASCAFGITVKYNLFLSIERHFYLFQPLLEWFYGMLAKVSARGGHITAISSVLCPILGSQHHDLGQWMICHSQSGYY